MVFVETILTLKSTDKDNPQRTDFAISRGLIHRLVFDFPPGSFGLLHLQLFDGKYQLFPASVGNDLGADNRLIEFDESYLKIQPPYHLTCLSWNFDSEYDHSVNIMLAIAETEAYMSRFMPSISLDKFSKVMAETQRQQQLQRDKQISDLTKQITNI